MRTKPALTAEDCKTIAAAAEAEARRKGWAVAIAILDDGAHLLHLHRMDGTSPHTAEVSQRKARTAALTRQATKVSEDRLKNRMGFLSVSGFVPLQGGVPITWQGQCVGGIGISGGPTPEVDEQIAAAGLAPFAAQV